MADAERILWPEIFDLPSAKRAARPSVAISCFIAGVIVLLVLSSLGASRNPLSRPPTALFEAGLWLVIALGIFKMSRVAALTGLALLLYNIAWVGGVFSWPSILFVIFLFSGVRATFVYHRINIREQSAA